MPTRGADPFSRLCWKSVSQGAGQTSDGKQMTIYSASVLHIEDVRGEMDAQVMVTLVKGWDEQLEHFVRSCFESIPTVAAANGE